MQEEIILSTIAIIVSIISIMAAVACSVIAFFQNRKLNNINMKSRFYEKIFDDFLISEIPKARKYLRFDNGHLVDGDVLGDVLNNMLLAALFFKYDKHDFYEELKERVQSLEDYILKCGNKSFDDEEQAQVYSEIHKKIEEIYKCINTYYIGKKKGSL